MANKYESEVYRCMDPTLELYGRTESPLHRAILLNYWRHRFGQEMSVRKAIDEKAAGRGKSL